MLARELDRESIVLLKNDEKILPISKDAKVAVIGPMADGFMNYGDYVVYRSQYRGTTPLAGIRNAVGNGSVSYAQGCERWSADQSGFLEAIAAAINSSASRIYTSSRALIDRALRSFGPGKIL